VKKDSQTNQDAGGLDPKETSQNATRNGAIDGGGNKVTRTVSTVGHVKNRSISQKDLDSAAPSGQSNIDPGRKS
jgi:hypothetical protein